MDTLVFESIVLGADGWIAGLVCAFPTETVAMYELIKALRIKEALEISQMVYAFVRIEYCSSIGAEHVVK